MEFCLLGCGHVGIAAFSNLALLRRITEPRTMSDEDDDELEVDYITCVGIIVQSGGGSLPRDAVDS